MRTREQNTITTGLQPRFISCKLSGFTKLFLRQDVLCLLSCLRKGSMKPGSLQSMNLGWSWGKNTFLLIKFENLQLYLVSFSLCRNPYASGSMAGERPWCSGLSSSGTGMSQAHSFLQARNSHLAAWLPSIGMKRELGPGTFRNA